jgi:hypothetical protein
MGVRDRETDLEAGMRTTLRRLKAAAEAAQAAHTNPTAQPQQGAFRHDATTA